MKNDTCLNNFPLDLLSDENRKWFCEFYAIFEKHSMRLEEYLKMCDCFSNFDWKKNFKRAAEFLLYEKCQEYKNLVQKITDSRKANKKVFTLFDSTNSRIPDILSEWKNLKSIHIRSSDIHFLNLQNFESIMIQEIIFFNTPMYELKMDPSINLKVLKMNRCRLFDLKKILAFINQSPNLSTIDLSHNYLEGDFDCSLLNLQILELEGNKITRLELNTKSLTYLNITETNIQRLSDNILSKLISLQWSNIRSGKCFIDNFKLLKTIQHLQFCNNQITFDAVENDDDKELSFFLEKILSFLPHQKKLNFWRSFSNSQLLLKKFPNFKF